MSDILVEKKKEFYNSFKSFYLSIDEQSNSKLIEIFGNLYKFFDNSLSDFKSAMDEYEDNMLLL